MASDWQVAVDPQRLTGWMDAQGLGEGPLDGACLLTGGTQNILLRFERAGRGFVLRRPPLQPRPQANTTIAREARVLAALAGSAVPHPHLIASCTDTAVLGAAFYLMDPVEGFNPSGPHLPLPHADDPAMRHAMGLSAVDALLALGEIDPVSAGMSDFGKPAGFLQRQVPRWRGQLDGYSGLTAWPGAQGLPGVLALGDWLEAHRPADSTPGILHGDFHLSNLMFSRDGAAVAAVIDWELSTLGDPLLDLGWLVATWPDASGRGAGTIHVQPWAGFASADELLARYRARSRRDLSHIDWYIALAAYKLGILLEGSYARACAGQAPREVGDRHHDSARRLIGDALRRIH